jgi:hypothetical protein
MTPRLLLAGLALSLAVPRTGDAQVRLIPVGSVPDSATVEVKVDFAIPDIPAMSMLNIDQNKLLRPATPRALASSFSGFASGQAFAIPEAFALEVSPFLLLHGETLTRQQYRSKVDLARLRLSGGVGPVAENDNRRGVAVGMRYTFLDHTDPRLSNAYRDDIDAVLRDVDTAIVRLRITSGSPLVCPPNEPENCVERILDFSLIAPQLQAARDSIVKIHERFVRDNWNRPIVDIAIASRAAGTDSVGNDLRMDRHTVWFAAGVPVGSRGQLLLGAHGGAERERVSRAEWEGIVGGSTRIYFGTNQRKLLVESQLTGTSGRRPELLLNSGVEARLHTLAWLSGAAGATWEGRSRPRLTARLFFKAALADIVP